MERRIADAARDHKRSLNLTDLRLTAVPDSIGQLTALTELYLNSNQLTVIPDSIGQLTALTRLSLNSNQLTVIPESIGQLTALTELDLNGNQLTVIPESIGQLTALTELGLAANQLTVIPDSIGQLTALTNLSFAANQLTVIPDSIGQLTALTELYLNGNQLTVIPDSIGQLTALTELYLNINQLTVIPDSIGQLTALTKLDLKSNQLTVIPDWIGQLTALTRLDLKSNQLTVIPESIGQLTALTELDLAANQLTVIPDWIGQLTALTKLYLNSNQLTVIPDWIGQLAALTRLDLNSNQLTVIPDSIGQLTALTRLDLSGNPHLSGPPQEIQVQGTEAVLAFLRALTDSSVDRWRSKMLIVGEATVGKTSLAKQLLGEAFDPGERQTHGVRVHSLFLPHPNRPGITMDLDVWDFGGQLEYRATQRFYLTDRSLFLLVWNSRARAADGKVTAWLDAITARAPNAPILLVATHGDENSPATLPHDLRDNYPSIAEVCTVDSRTRLGIDPLCDAIARHAAALPLMGVRWPAPGPPLPYPRRAAWTDCHHAPCLSAPGPGGHPRSDRPAGYRPDAP